MMPTVVLSDGGKALLPQALALLSEAGVPVVDAEVASPDDPLAVIREAEIILAFWYPLREEVLAQLTRCKLIVRIGIGIDSVDVEAARRLGIPVSNVPDYCIDEVADHAFAMALSLLRQLPVMDRDIRAGYKATLWQPIHSYRALTFATLGFGRIARAVLERARPSKFQLAAYDPYQPDSVFTEAGVRRLTLDELFTEADLISLHSPLTPETHHIVNAARLAQMKPTAYLVNTSRGGLIDTPALAAALDARTIVAAALDVFEKEPLEADNPIRDCTNTVLAPHMAWYSEEAMVTLHIMAAEEAIRAARGETLRSCVNGLASPAAVR